MSAVLLLAAVYNILWGLWAVAFPNSYFQWIHIPTPNYPELWQCIGMIVGVYGLGYGIAATNPYRHWPIVLVGLLGKVLGPIGLVQHAFAGTLPWRFAWVNLSNDLIWWIPFTLILWGAWRASHAPRRFSEAELPLPVKLYPRILGENWGKLDADLRDFHTTPYESQGWMNIEKGGFVATLLTKIAGLPKAGEKIPTLLHVLPQDSEELWLRHFSDRPYPSQQMEKNRELLETVGPYEFAMRLSVEGGNLIYRSYRMQLRIGELRLPLPGFMQAKIFGRETIDPTSRNLKVHIDVDVPILGKVIAYRGEIEARSAKK